MRKLLYAHTKSDNNNILPKDMWQSLESHLNAVADITRKFSHKFDCGALGETIGLLHDIGKATTEFQSRLEGSPGHVDHKTEGARQAVIKYGNAIGKVMAYCIAGHHGGLPDDESVDEHMSLCEMLAQQSADLLTQIDDLPLLSECVIKSPSIKTKEHRSFYIHMLIRMLYSSLVDSDYLDTEAFMQPEIAALRKEPIPISEIMRRFQPKLNELLSLNIDSTVYIARRSVLDACINAGKMTNGFFTLTVPTGGGKTLSSMDFALEHIKTHGMSRVIYAIPFTSITEQTASVFREIFGRECVLEHHSNIDTDQDDNETTRLICQNWDAPLIVTTNVQLLESIFSSKPTRCRKLHNLVNSVIILDEAQTLPDSLLLPTISALKSLCSDFGATVVFCTATQPALDPKWFDGIDVHEIIPEPQELFKSLKRAKIERLGTVANDELADRIKTEYQALCIVNTKSRAVGIFNRLPCEDGAFHLSASMCPQHRSGLIAEIKLRLKNNERCIVVSTQLIEAGVDIDFPIVYREIAGMDAIAQAAGRCNREGKLKHSNGEPILGRVFVFNPEKALPSGWFSQMAQFGRETMKKFDDSLSPEAIEHFFRLRYHDNQLLDKHKILEGISRGAGNISFNYAQISNQYKIIDDASIDIIIPFNDKCKKILANAKASTHPLVFLHKLQRYMVSVYTKDFKQLSDRGLIEKYAEQMNVLSVNDIEFSKVYSEKIGLIAKPESEILLI